MHETVPSHAAPDEHLLCLYQQAGVGNGYRRRCTAGRERVLGCTSEVGGNRKRQAEQACGRRENYPSLPRLGTAEMPTHSAPVLPPRTDRRVLMLPSASVSGRRGKLRSLQHKSWLVAYLVTFGYMLLLLWPAEGRFATGARHDKTGDTRHPAVTGPGRITSLTSRQVEVLELAAHGLSGRQIGRRLGISARTVEGHFSKMRRRTGARSEAELTAYGVAAGLITIGSARARPGVIPAREAASPRPWPGARKRPFADTPGRAVNPQENSVGNTGRKLTPGNPSPDGSRHMLLGYARVSTSGQNPDHQIDALVRAGVPLEQIYLDTAGSARASRPQLDLLLQVLRAGDTLKVTRLDRLSRSVLHLITLCAQLGERGVGLHVIEQGIDTTTAEGRAMFGMLSVLAELQRELIVVNTRDGLAAARARGRGGGRPPRLTPDQAALARQLYNTRAKTVQQIADILRVPRSTLYGYLGASTTARQPRKAPVRGKARTRADKTSIAVISSSGPHRAGRADARQTPLPAPGRVAPIWPGWGPRAS